jgi:protein involved in polysaccharide export with SLBB domain
MPEVETRRDPAPGFWLSRDETLPLFAEQLILGNAAGLQRRNLSEEYRIQPGDTLRLVTWGGVTLNENVPVAPDGSFVIPGVASLPLAGMTRFHAQEAVIGLIRSQFKNGGAIVIVAEASAVTITVVGEVPRPGMQVIPGNGTVLDALAAAGGVLKRGSLRRIQIKQPGLEGTVVDIYDLAQGRELGLLSPLRPETLIVVPLAGPQVQVYGQARRNYTFELTEAEMHYQQVLDLAGGFTPLADQQRIRLLREGPQGQVISLHSWAELATLPIADRDRIQVPTLPELSKRYDFVTIEGQVASPGRYPIEPGLTVGRLIALAGGLTPQAAERGASILRHLREPTALDLNDEVKLPVYQDLLTGLSNDSPIQALDVLMIPQRPDLADSTLQVRISGAVRKPGSYPLLPDMTLSDLIALANGVTAGAQLDVADLVRVVRTGDTTRVDRQSVDLRPVMNQREQGLLLKNGDLLVVRSMTDERITIEIGGEVVNSGSLTLPAGTTLSQALAIAGGTTRWAFPEGLKFFRPSEAAAAEERLGLIRAQLAQAKSVNEALLNQATDREDRQRLQATVVNQETELARMEKAQATGRMTGIDLVNILAGDAEADFQLQNGDRIVIPKRPDTIRVLGQVMTPGSLRFEPGLKVEQVLQRSGGLSQYADEQRIFVVRADGTVVASAAFKGTAWDPEEKRWVRTRLERIELREGDTVLVPPDLRYRVSGMELAKDWSQVLFQLATTVGTIAVLAQ